MIDPPVVPYASPMRLNANCEDWHVPADYRVDDDGSLVATNVRGHYGGMIKAHATLRRIGWLDQKGRIWLAVPPSAGFDGGSLTPLLVDVRD